MFKFLKEKLSSVVKKFSKDVEEESEIIEIKNEEKQELQSEINEQKQEIKKEGKIEKKQSAEAGTSEDLMHKLKSEKKKTAEKQTAEEKTQKKEKPEKETKKDEKEDKKENIIEKQNKESEEKEEEPEHKKGLFSKIFRKKDKHEDDEVSKDEKNLDIAITKEDLDETQKKIEIKEFETIKTHSEEKESETKETDVQQEAEPEMMAQQEEPEQEKEILIPEEKKEKKEEKKGFFSKITETFTKINLSEEKFEELFWELEVMLLENNVAVEVIQKIKEDLKKELMSDKISRKNVDEIIKDSLKKSLEEILDIKGFNIEDGIKHKKPYVIAVIGVNGSGKTTTIAKLCHLLKKKGHSVVLAAADTFRAAAIQQLEHHAEKLDVKLIKHDYNSDPAAVAFDAIKHAEAKKIDVVVIDTAGRLHSNDNLMNELKKLIKVNKPDLKLFVGESITGNDCVEQAKVYDEIIGIDAIILSKADVDEKGGAALSISYVTKKPVLFIGTGQTYDDLKIFDKKEIMEGLGF